MEAVLIPVQSESKLLLLDLGVFNSLSSNSTNTSSKLERCSAQYEPHGCILVNAV